MISSNMLDVSFTKVLVFGFVFKLWICSRHLIKAVSPTCVVDGNCHYCRYYADIRQTISASDQEMNSALAELSRVSRATLQSPRCRPVQVQTLTNLLLCVSELLWRAQLPGGTARAVQVHQQVLRSGVFTPSSGGVTACIMMKYITISMFD